jgi:putative ABC transport system permease protein
MFGHYVTIAIRSFRRAPVTASVNVLSLALGLAAFVTAYGVVNFWDRSERHFPSAERIYVVTADLEARDGSVRTGVQPSTNRLYAEHLRADFPEFEAVARAQVMNAEAGVSAGDLYTRMFVVAVEREFLDIFGLPFIAGDADQALREPNSVVLTKDAAARLFGASEAIGRTVTLGSVLDVTVVGVIDTVPEPSHMGRSASASLRFDVLASWDTLEGLQAAVRARDAARNPAAAPAASPAPNPPPANAPPPPENWLGNYCCTTYVMVDPASGLDESALNAQLRAFGERHLPPAQAELASLTIGAVPVTGLMVAQLNAQLFSGAVSITSLLQLLGGLVLVVACVNYANLATAQAARRAREVGLRKAIGAGKYRVMLQYLAEASLLTIAAAAVALIAIGFAAPLVRNALGIDLNLGLFADTGFWLFLGGLLVTTTLLGGAYPAFVLSRVPPVEALRIGRARVGPRFAGTLLVGMQFAAASFLLIVMIVMYAQNLELKRTGLGRTSDPALVVANFQQFSGVDTALLQTELGRLPQVTAATESGSPPWNTGVNLAMFGRTPDENTVLVTAYQHVVGYDFFSTLDFDLLAGRAFDREHGEDVAPQNVFGSGQTLNVVIDAALSRQLGFVEPREAVDQTVYFPERMTRAFGATAQPLRIVGVVSNRPLNLSAAGATANFYMLRTGLAFQIVRLSAQDVSAGLAAVDALWNRLSPNVSINRDFMDELFNESYENFGRINQAFAGLAFLAVVISVIGLFGMAIQVASRRVHEIGVRKSVGARTSQIVAMLLRDFSKPVLVANLLVWVPAYLAAQQYLNVFMQRIDLTPLPFVLSLTIALAISCAAVGGQALRAARVSPAHVLRFE